MLGPVIHKPQLQCIGRRIERSLPVEPHAGARILRSQANRHRAGHAIGAHLRHHVGDVRLPVAHAHVHRHPELLAQQPSLLQRQPRQRAAANRREPVLHFFHGLLRQRTSARHAHQILGNFLHRIRRPVRQQQHRIRHAAPPAHIRARTSPPPAHFQPASPAQFRARD